MIKRLTVAAVAAGAMSVPLAGAAWAQRCSTDTGGAGVSVSVNGTQKVQKGSTRTATSDPGHYVAVAVNGSTASSTGGSGNTAIAVNNSTASAPAAVAWGWSGPGEQQHDHGDQRQHRFRRREQQHRPRRSTTAPLPHSWGTTTPSGRPAGVRRRQPVLAAKPSRTTAAPAGDLRRTGQCAAVSRASCTWRNAKAAAIAVVTTVTHAAEDFPTRSKVGD